MEEIHSDWCLPLAPSWGQGLSLQLRCVSLTRIEPKIFPCMCLCSYHLAIPARARQVSLFDYFVIIFPTLNPTIHLQESECKAYNPRPFCKTYTMDKQPLNTGEQKDMTEFFTDLITKIEEMSPELVCTRILKFLDICRDLPNLSY